MSKVILAHLTACGYKPGQITPATYIYHDTGNRPKAIEKHTRDSYPIDEGDYGGSYIDSYMWDSERKLAAIERAGGKGAQTRHNIRKANEALAQYQS